MCGEGPVIYSAMFPGCLPCAEHHSSHWTYSNEQNRFPDLVESTF